MKNKLIIMIIAVFSFSAKAELPSYYSVHSAHKLADQSLLVVGTAGQQNNLMDFMAIKFQGNGLLDRGFGDQGVVRKDISGDQDQATSALLLPDGSIVLGGVANIKTTQYPGGMYDLGLVKIGPNGAIDPSFGVNGKVTQDISGYQDNLAKILLQSDGKIIAVGGAYVSDATQMEFFIARFNADGSLDTTFNNGIGFITTNLGPFQDEPSSALIQPDGKIVVSGISNRGGPNYDFAIVRFNPDGSIDNSFGNNGLVFTDMTPNGASVPINEYWNSIAIQGDGKILLYGGSPQAGGMQRVLIRYLPDGTIDTGFGQDGFVKSVGNAGSVVPVSDGTILLSAGTFDAKIKALRVTSQGALDTSFGGAGEVEFISQYGGNPPNIILDSGGDFSLVGNIFDQAGNTGTYLASYSEQGQLISSVMVASDTTAEFKGSEADDAIFVGSKVKTLDGGGGNDGAAFIGNESDYIIREVAAPELRSLKKSALIQNPAFTIEHKSGLYGTKTVRNFEKLVFEDRTVELRQLVSTPGSCGAAANLATAYTPVTNLCSAGNSGQVLAGASNWLWTCAGNNGGAKAACTAPYAPTYEGGPVGAVQVQSIHGWQIDQSTSGFVALPAPGPEGVSLSGGATKVVLNSGAAGSSATITLRFSSIPVGARLYKYGKENGPGDGAKWFPFPATIDRAAGTVTYTLTDGQRGDNDWVANGVIDDPVALGVGGVGDVVAVPTLNEWAMILLSGLMAIAALATMRRRVV